MFCHNCGRLLAAAAEAASLPRAGIFYFARPRAREEDT